jgi:hypothetical protein
MKNSFWSRGGIIVILGFFMLASAAASYIQTRNVRYGTNAIVGLYFVSYGIYLYFGRTGKNIAIRDALFNIISGLIGFIVTTLFLLVYGGGVVFGFNTFLSLLFIALFLAMVIWGAFQYVSLRHKGRSEV